MNGRRYAIRSNHNHANSVTSHYLIHRDEANQPVSTRAGRVTLYPRDKLSRLDQENTKEVAQERRVNLADTRKRYDHLVKDVDRNAVSSELRISMSNRAVVRWRAAAISTARSLPINNSGQIASLRVNDDDNDLCKSQPVLSAGASASGARRGPTLADSSARHFVIIPRRVRAHACRDLDLSSLSALNPPAE